MRDEAAHGSGVIVGVDADVAFREVARVDAGGGGAGGDVQLDYHVGRADRLAQFRGGLNRLSPPVDDLSSHLPGCLVIFYDRY